MQEEQSVFNLLAQHLKLTLEIKSEQTYGRRRQLAQVLKDI